MTKVLCLAFDVEDADSKDSHVCDEAKKVGRADISPAIPGAAYTRVLVPEGVPPDKLRLDHPLGLWLRCEGRSRPILPAQHLVPHRPMRDEVRLGARQNVLASGADQRLIVENKHLGLRYDRKGVIVESLLHLARLNLVETEAHSGFVGLWLSTAPGLSWPDTASTPPQPRSA